MKIKWFYLLFILFLLSCSQNSNKTNPIIGQANKGGTASGSYEIKIGEDVLICKSFDPLYTDFIYEYKGKNSTVSARIRDSKTEDNILLTLYGDKNFVKNPKGVFENFLYSENKEGNKVDLQFILRRKVGLIGGIYTIKSGSLKVEQLKDGELIASFEALGGTAGDVARNQNLIPISGKIEMISSTINRK